MRQKTRVQAMGAVAVQVRERMANTSEFVVEARSAACRHDLGGRRCEAAVGGRCLIDTARARQIEAEIVGFSGDKLPDAHGRHPRHHAGARVFRPPAMSTCGGDELLRSRSRRGRRLRSWNGRAALHRSGVPDRRAAQTRFYGARSATVGRRRALDQLALSVGGGNASVFLPARASANRCARHR